MATATLKVTTPQSATPGNNKKIHNGIAGVCAGVLAKSTVQPLDFLRTRLQVHDCCRSDYSLVRTVYDIFKADGFFSLYRGLSANLLGSGVNWGIYFFSYETIKSSLTERHSSHSHSTHTHNTPSSVHFASGMLSGIAAITVTNPIWCVKTRLQISTDYRGVTDCFLRICKEEGFLRLYRGLGPAYVLVLNPALQFTFYEKLKVFFTHLHSQYDVRFVQHTNTQLTSTDFLMMGALAKCMSSSMVYPMQLVRARLFQTEKSVLTDAVGNLVIQNKYHGVYDCVKRIVCNEGIQSLYKGLSINLIKTVPSSALTFMFYENTIKLLQRYG